MAIESQQNANDQVAAIVAATSNLYLDFDRNADDNTDAKGRRFPGLRRQLEELRRRHFGLVLPDMPPGADMLALFRESFFPNGMTQSYVVCNLSLQENQPYLAIRPKVIGPRLEHLIPRGMTLAVCARLWDSQRGRRQDGTREVARAVSVWRRGCVHTIRHV